MPAPFRWAQHRNTPGKRAGWESGKKMLICGWDKSQSNLKKKSIFCTIGLNPTVLFEFCLLSRKPALYAPIYVLGGGGLGGGCTIIQAQALTELLFLFSTEPLLFPANFQGDEDEDEDLNKQTEVNVKVGCSTHVKWLSLVTMWWFIDWS